MPVQPAAASAGAPRRQRDSMPAVCLVAPTRSCCSRLCHGERCCCSCSAAPPAPWHTHTLCALSNHAPARSEHEARTLLSFTLTAAALFSMFILRRLGSALGDLDHKSVSEAALLKQARGWGSCWARTLACVAAGCCARWLLQLLWRAAGYRMVGVLVAAPSTRSPLLLLLLCLACCCSSPAAPRHLLLLLTCCCCSSPAAGPLWRRSRACRRSTRACSTPLPAQQPRAAAPRPRPRGPLAPRGWDQARWLSCASCWRMWSSRTARCRQALPWGPAGRAGGRAARRALPRRPAAGALPAAPGSPPPSDAPGPCPLGHPACALVARRRAASGRRRSIRRRRPTCLP